MASPSRLTTNDENPSRVKPTTVTRDSDVSLPSPRRPLGEVSANAKLVNSGDRNLTPTLMSKSLAGSPLKRSFTAAMEEEGGGVGWMYFKKRRSGELGGLSGRASGEGRVFGGGEGGVLSLPTDIAVIAEPSPTEPNTPSDHGNDRENASSHNGSSEERKSFSSLINYHPSSQTRPDAATTATASSSLFRNISNAELLRLRLRVAMYKVRTNQISTPFAKLPDPEQAERNRVNAAVEEAVAALRREAKEVLERNREEVRRREGEVPTLLPAPVLRPTAYSSRFIYEGKELPSSPPARLSLGQVEAEVEESATPSGRRRLAGVEEAELTSSVVKEKVVQGLLGLRNAT